uniref:Ovule protein n=1 Tax=Anisakis simplex TaxID=6269 RepID=A0A0M3JQE6_ANISI
LEPTKQSDGEELTRKHQMSDEAATKRIRTCPIRMAAKRSLPKKESAPNMDDEGDKLTKDPQSTVASVSKQDKPGEKKVETRRRSPPKRSVNEVGLFFHPLLSIF